MKRHILLLLSSLLLVQAPLFAELDREELAKVDQLSRVLDLTPVQRSKLTKEREKSKRNLLSLEQKWQKLHNQLRQEVRREKPDKAAIRKISNEIGKIQGEIVSLRTSSLVYLKSILTPSQITILEEGRKAY